MKATRGRSRKDLAMAQSPVQSSRQKKKKENNNKKKKKKKKKGVCGPSLNSVVLSCLFQVRRQNKL